MHHLFVTLCPCVSVCTWPLAQAEAEAERQERLRELKELEEIEKRRQEAEEEEQARVRAVCVHVCGLCVEGLFCGEEGGVQEKGHG
jgi:hypothetical protein